MAEDVLERAKSAVRERSELPGMSLMEHLSELRNRIIYSAGYLLVGAIIAYIFHNRLIDAMQRPLLNIGLEMTMTHPTDALNLAIKTSLVCGAILASPFILYQVWLFISPGMYSHEKRYVWPFMFATIGLFLIGAWFGYRYVLPGAMKVLIVEMGSNLNHMITIEDYTGFFLAVILGLGVTFELPIVIFFLALFGIVDGKFLLRHFRYAVLAIFLLAAIICPTPDPIGMCLFATPMLLLYFAGVGIAFLVRADADSRSRMLSGIWLACGLVLILGLAYVWHHTHGFHNFLLNHPIFHLHSTTPTASTTSCSTTRSSIYTAPHQKLCLPRARTCNHAETLAEVAAPTRRCQAFHPACRSAARHRHRQPGPLPHTPIP